MKKIITILAAASLMLISTQAFAQLSVGVGYINSTAKTKAGSSVSTLPSNGVYAGAEYNITDGKGFGISAGAYYSYLVAAKSGSGSIAGIQLGGTAKVEEMYLDIPVNFNLSAKVNNSLRAFIFAGPTFSVGLSSTTKGEGSIGGINLETGKHDNYSEEGYNRFDILLGGGLGVDYGSLRFKLGYNAGMLNRLDSDNMSQKRNVLTAGIAFLF
ncbi:MAG: porin family protein [Bacteroidales bacterium]|nr:porin family protein [Bacteroidales bacterium]